jgi:hypothetical protein
MTSGEFFMQTSTELTSFTDVMFKVALSQKITIVIVLLKGNNKNIRVMLYFSVIYSVSHTSSLEKKILVQPHLKINYVKQTYVIVAVKLY